jgi:hypothetical protein
MKKNKKNTSNYSELGFAKVDLRRKKIKGYPETIFCIGKKPEQIVAIAKKLYLYGEAVLATKADKKIYSAIKLEFPNAKYHEDAKIISIGCKTNSNGAINKTKKKNRATILVITAGTTDIPIAEEAAITAEFMGKKVERLYDVGIAGLHRLLSNLKRIRSADALIVVAGMEGALPSVVSGLTTKPVIAVPTSIGYGSHFKGITALLSMLNSCSPGVAVMNINNGFGAGYFASLILNKRKK